MKNQSILWSQEVYKKISKRVCDASSLWFPSFLIIREQRGFYIRQMTRDTAWQDISLLRIILRRPSIVHLIYHHALVCIYRPRTPFGRLR